MKPKRHFYIILIIVLILLIPLISMQFTSEVLWSVFDFIIAAILLLSAGLGIELILRNVKTIKTRIIFSAILFAIVSIIYIELAVGILETRFAGS